MSFILEALKKAERQRSQGTLPRLVSPAGLAGSSRGLPEMWPLAIGLLGTVALVAAAWLIWRASPEATPAPQATPASAAAGGTGTAPIVGQAGSSPPPSPGAVSDARARSAPEQAREPASAQVSASLSAGGGQDEPRRAPQRRAAGDAGNTAGGPPATAPRAAPAPIPLAQAPDDLRREVLALKFTGAAWSSTPSMRLVLAAGEVMGEGTITGNGVKIVEIRPRSVVLDVRGTRIEAPY